MNDEITKEEVERLEELFNVLFNVADDHLIDSDHDLINKVGNLLKKELNK